MNSPNFIFAFFQAKRRQLAPKGVTDDSGFTRIVSSGVPTSYRGLDFLAYQTGHRLANRSQQIEKHRLSSLRQYRFSELALELLRRFLGKRFTSSSFVLSKSRRFALGFGRMIARPGTRIAQTPGLASHLRDVSRGPVRATRFARPDRVSAAIEIGCQWKNERLPAYSHQRVVPPPLGTF